MPASVTAGIACTLPYDRKLFFEVVPVITFAIKNKDVLSGEYCNVVSS